MMAILEVIKYPGQSLKTRAKNVDRITKEEADQLNDMADTMYISHGVGLAATQVGIDKQLAVIDIGQGLVKLVNPVITRRSGWETMEEGCLSAPGIQVKVRRSRKISVRAMNEKGSPVAFEAEGLFARAIQHEVDHLRGKLIIDYLGPVKKFMALRRKKLPNAI